jgi:osmotically-inducible protein OsmY
VNVIGSVAYLVGDVDSFFEEQEAVQAAAAVRGVLSVKNHINVIEPNIYSYNPYLDEYHDHDYDFYRAPQPRQGVRTDAEIRETIKDRMSWNPFVDAGEVNVTVDHGVATLTGAVDTWAERDAATDDAYKGGATWVENDLRVRY